MSESEDRHIDGAKVTPEQSDAANALQVQINQLIAEWRKKLNHGVKLRGYTLELRLTWDDEQ